MNWNKLWFPQQYNHLHVEKAFEIFIKLIFKYKIR